MNNKAEGIKRNIIRCSILLLMSLMLWHPGTVYGARNYENEKEAFSFMLNEMKLSPAAASGIMANIFGESNFSTTALGGGGSYGICQWLGSRKSALIRFCSSKGLEQSSLKGQLLFLEYELESVYPSTYSSIKNVSDDEEGAYNAAYIFCYQFERPANKAYRSSQRGGYAKSIYWPEYGALSARLSAEAKEKGIVLSWETYTDKTYMVYRSLTENGSYKKIGKASAPGDGTFTDGNTKKGVTYYYQLRPSGSASDTAYWSNIVAASRTRKLNDEECSVSISRTEYTYNGKERKPKVTVIYDGEKLKKNQDYTVSYKKNTDAGKSAFVKVEGIGNYEGSVKIKFRINKASQKLSSGLLRIPYSGEKEKVDAGQQGKITLKSSNKSVLRVYGQKLKALRFGTSTITISAAATKNYKAAKITVEAVVVPPTPSFRSITPGSVSGNKMDVNLRWIARKSPDGFEIQYTNKSVFGHSAKKLKSEKGKLRKYKIRGLNAGKTWKFRIRIVKTVKGKKVYSNWSEIVTLGEN